MKIIVGNNESTLITGGLDNLLPCKNLFKEIFDYMAIKRPGSFHSRKAGEKYNPYKEFQYFLSKQGKFATGFLPLVINFARELGAKVTLIDERVNMPQFVYIDEREWRHNVDWTLRDNQQDTVNQFEGWLEYDEGKFFYWPRGIADAATNTGKNSILSGAFRNIKQVSGLLLIDSYTIFEQLYDILSVDFNVGRINSKSKGVPARFEWGEDITIAMVQTLASHLEKSVNVEMILNTRFNVLAVDECHKASAKVFSNVITHVNAGGRIFVSGTPLEKANKLANMIVVGLSGPVLKKITKKELMDAGHSNRVKVFVHLSASLLHDFQTYDQQLRIGIWENRNRADIAGKIISEKKETEQILINFRTREHGQLIYEYLSDVYGFDRMEVVDGVDKDRRDKILRFKSGETRILIASDILMAGFSKKDVNILIYMREGKARIASSQWSGRIERKDDSVDNSEIHEIWDEGKYLSKHSRARIKFWKDEGFEVIYLYNHNQHGSPV